MARPSKYTDELAGKICDRLIGGESLARICQDSDLPSKRTVYRWENANDKFLTRYQLAREWQAELFRWRLSKCSSSAPMVGCYGS